MFSARGCICRYGPDQTVGAASGLAAVGSLAGCPGVLGSAPGGSRPRDWQFDVGAVSETPNRFFGTVDHAGLAQNREHLPASVRETVETAAYTPLDAGAVEAMVRSEGDPDAERDYGGAIENVEATYDGEAVVVTVTGQTQSLLDGTAIGHSSGPA